MREGLGNAVVAPTAPQKNEAVAGDLDEHRRGEAAIARHRLRSRCLADMAISPSIHLCGDGGGLPLSLFCEAWPSKRQIQSPRRDLSLANPTGAGGLGPKD